jgi:hypothetical protein
MPPAKQAASAAKNPLAVRFTEWAGIDDMFVVAFMATGVLLQFVGTIIALAFGQSWGVRVIGLAMTGSAWMVHGTTVTMANPDTMFGFNAITAGLLSWWYALRLLHKVQSERQRCESSEAQPRKREGAPLDLRSYPVTALAKQCLDIVTVDVVDGPVGV